MTATLPRIAVLGASGLIGQAVAEGLVREGFAVTAVARRFTPAQRAAFGPSAVEAPIVELPPAELARLLGECGAELVVNCIGVLQESRRSGSAADVHVAFVARLLEAMRACSRPLLLVHLSVPGRDTDDRTAFSRTKREAERLIAASPVPFAVLRPGFVIAPAAFGGSALIRALAALPFELPGRESASRFAVTALADITRTVAVLARRFAGGEREWSAAWDIMARRPTTVKDVVDAFRRHFGGPKPRLRLPAWTMRAGAVAGDLAARLGWSPPIRGTALVEMRRGVVGDPEPWTAATGIEPASLERALAALPTTVQERWFARLYLLKPVAIGMLAVFWAASGLIALMVAFDAAVAVLTTRGFSPPLAVFVTVASCLADIAIGLGIAWRRTCGPALLAGIAVSVFYMVSAAVLTPDLWVEPLGALVKTGPAIVLMLVALATLDER